MRLAFDDIAEEHVDDRFHPRGFVPPAVNENLPDIGKPHPRRRVLLRLPRALELPEKRQRQLRAALSEEISHGRLMLFSPVACGSGAALWFSSPVEPSAPYLLLLLCVVGGVFLLLRFRHVLAAALAASLVFLLTGALLAALETARTETVVIDKPVTTTITGTVTARESALEGRWRYELAVTQTADPQLRRMPGAIAVFGRSRAPLAIGDHIRGRVRLTPPSGPALPGLTDFAFASFFNGSGGTGFFYGQPLVLPATPLSAGQRLLSRFHDWRAGIGDHIRAVIGGDEGAFAAALVTNEQRPITRPTMEALRLSGLAHIIAISGMNMALAAGLSFVGLRSLLSLSVGLGQSLPVKKIAAVGAILAVTVYFTISGFAVSAERAYIMMVIMLIAVLFDRPAISMRNTALSAWAILLTGPDALMGASFQMSYAGTLGLVAGYEFWARHRSRERHQGLPLPRLVTMIGKSAGAAIASSAIGGTATALFSLVHFQRLASLSLIANVLVTLILSLLVMPMLMVAILLMPLGLDRWPLLLMGWGLKWVIATGVWVAGWGGQWLPGRLPNWFFISMTLGLLVLALLSTWLRLIGLAMAVLSCLLLVTLPAVPRPDLVIAEDGLLAAFVAPGELSPNQTKPSDFIFGQWQRALQAMQMRKPVLLAVPPDVRHDDRSDRYRPLTDEEEIAERLFVDATLSSLPPNRFACKKAAWCVARYGRGGVLMILANRIYSGLACDMATMVVSDVSRGFTACRSGALLISRETLRRTGALSIRFTDDPLRPKLVPSLTSVLRPWQAFRAYDWRTGQHVTDIPPQVLSLIGDKQTAITAEAAP